MYPKLILCGVCVFQMAFAFPLFAGLYGTMRMNCGGPAKGFKTIKGCFASLGTTRYATFEDGSMEGPGQSATIQMVNKSLCVLTLMLGPSLIPGFYRCGSILPSKGEQAEHALFAAFNVSSSGVGTMEPVELRNTSDHEEALAGYPSEETTVANLTATRETGLTLSVPYVILVVLGVSAALLLAAITGMMIKTVGTRRYERSPPGTGRSMPAARRSYGSYSSFYQPSNKLRQPKLTTSEDPTVEFPPPMDLIPAESIARYISRCPPAQQKWCTCPKKPFSPSDNLV